MYIPTWLIIVIAVVGYFIYRSYINPEPETILEDNKISPEEIERRIVFIKEHRIFDLPHFDSPHFIDVQNAFDVMEINYLRLKQRFYNDSDRVRELAKDWFRYAQALGDLKHERVMFDVNMSDNAFENLEENSKEPSIIKDEVEKKFKNLLGDDFAKIPPDYFERMEKMEKPDKKTSQKLGIANEWKFFYRDSDNLFAMERKRRKQKEELDTKV